MMITMLTLLLVGVALTVFAGVFAFVDMLRGYQVRDFWVPIILTCYVFGAILAVVSIVGISL